ncbi:MAG TPA: hypothetical protein VF145_01625 [Chitinophagaceae bacterium]
MARNRSASFDLSGTLGKYTFVRSKYGKFVRAARGTHKPALCNETLTAVFNRNEVLNKAAKLVHDPLRMYAATYKENGLWQRMLSAMRRSPTNDLSDLLKTQEGREAHEKYPVSKIMISPSVRASHSKGVMTLELQCDYPPVFELTVEPPQYQCEMFVVLIDEDWCHTGVETVSTGWINTAEPLRKFETSFEISPVARYFLVILKVEAGYNGVAEHRSIGKGFRIMTSGMIGGEHRKNRKTGVQKDRDKNRRKEKASTRNKASGKTQKRKPKAGPPALKSRKPKTGTKTKKRYR